LEANVKRITKVLFVLVLYFVACFPLMPLLAGAVSYSPLQEEREEKAAKGVKVKGEMVCLFESGTPEIKKMLVIGDILSVYREMPSHELKEVGKVRVLSFVREDYLKAEVVEGELMPGDIAKKGDVASLMMSSDDKCK
jgi:hypothetical protein